MNPSTRALLFGVDPVPWLLTSPEPAARWITLTHVLGRPPDNPQVREAHTAVLADPGTAPLLGRIPDWEVAATLSGHDSPAYAPCLLELLAWLGVRPSDDPRVARLLEQMLAHQDDEGRFQSHNVSRARPQGAWGALLCDNHAIAAALIRHGLGDRPEVQRALRTAVTDITQTAQGRAWPCRPDPGSGWRGPGRKGDVCPQVTLEALLTFSRLRPEGWPRGVSREALLAAGKVSLGIWRDRGAEKPYMFGHGRQFKRVKWWPGWYGALAVIEALSGYPELWDNRAAQENRRTFCEVAACLLAYNVDPATGTITPRSCYRGFEAFSFGQKKQPSPLATARVLAALTPLEELAEEIAAVNVLALGSSKGGTGRALPPG